ASITNNSGATLEVTGVGVTLTIDNAAAFTNTGTLLATGQGELFLINDTVTNANGTVKVDANSILDLQSTTLNNGTFINSGLLEATVGRSELCLINDTVTNANGTVKVDANSILDLQSTTLNNGTFINSGLLEATVGASALHAAPRLNKNMR